MNQTSANPESVNPTKEACRRYLRQMAVIMGTYVVVLFVCVTELKRVPSGGLHYVLALLPLVPVLFLAPVLLRYLRETDEFERRLQLESLAIAAGFTAMVSVTYGFLEIAGFPHPSAWWTWTVLMMAWAIARPIVGRFYCQ